MEKMILKTNKRLECINITSRVVQLCQGKIEDGIILLYIPHTTAGIFINENTDPDVVTDFENTLSQIVKSDISYLHSEGNSDAHIKSSIIGSSVSIIVENGRIQLGRWQGIFFAEFDGPRTREVWCKFIPSI
ncbi:MAG: YjbQ family protein [Exilispira sp.]|nr:YjbQ family protein [Exilispira sp.]